MIAFSVEDTVDSSVVLAFSLDIIFYYKESGNIVDDGPVFGSVPNITMYGLRPDYRSRMIYFVFQKLNGVSHSICLCYYRASKSCQYIFNILICMFYAAFATYIGSVYHIRCLNRAIFQSKK